MSDQVDVLLKEAVESWTVKNPYAVVELASEYTSTGNPFLGKAESTWFAAARGELPEPTDDPLEHATLLWVEDHPTPPGELYSTVGNQFLWAAEGAFFTFLREASGRWTQPKRAARSRPQKQSIPKDLRWAIWDRDNFTCQHCGVRRDLAVDHIIPESEGGSLDPTNLQTLCKRCNSRKGVKRPEL